jgi:cell division septal protein FtsQ
MLLVPHRFSYTYPRDAIVEAVSAIPRVRDVRVTRVDRQSITVYFDEYIPYALWCLPEEPTNCAFLDSEGYAFASAPNLEGGALVRHIQVDNTELTLKQTFPSKHFKEVHDFIDRLHGELDLRVTDVMYTKDGDVELFINGGGSLKIAGEQNKNDAFRYLVSILASKEFKHLEPGNFKYIDLRFGNKVYVNEQLEPEIHATTTASTTATE